MKPMMMASSSMSPLRTAAPTVKPAEEPEPTIGLEAGSPAQMAAAYSEVVPAPQAAPKPKGKKKGAEDDDDKDKDDDKDDDDDEESKALAAGNDDRGDRVHLGIDVARYARECERGRLLSIIDSEAGKSAFAANPEKTLRFALTHPGTRLEAIATLELFGGNLQPAKALPLRERMEGVKVEIGQDAGGGPPNGSAAMAAAIVMAGKKRRGEID